MNKEKSIDDCAKYNKNNFDKRNIQEILRDEAKDCRETGKYRRFIVDNHYCLMTPDIPCPMRCKIFDMDGKERYGCVRRTDKKNGKSTR